MKKYALKYGKIYNKNIRKMNNKTIDNQLVKFCNQLSFNKHNFTMK